MNGDPTVGRIVLYRTAEHDSSELIGGSEILPAIITRVWTPTCVNLKVFTNHCMDLFPSSVLQGTDRGQWDWPIREAK